MDELDKIASHIQDKPKKPPLDKWHPQLSGDIDIQISSNGDWYHNGGLISRKPLVKLFASILRREADNHYYLVTPVEKWRIRVEDRPLIIIAAQLIHAGLNHQQVIFTSNVDDNYLLSAQYPLSVLIDSATGEPDPFISVDNNLTAKIHRPVYYQLADHAVQKDDGYIIRSDGCEFIIG